MPGHCHGAVIIVRWHILKTSNNCYWFWVG